jgi:hypothetical protein
MVIGLSLLEVVEEVLLYNLEIYLVEVVQTLRTSNKR